jgi:hypothetical protein
MIPEKSAPSAPAWLRPAWLLGGLVAGLVTLAWLGHRAAAVDYHPAFTRFFPAISPEAGYYPTVGEMAAIIRSRTKPDQVLVIVGGNSVLQGVAQPADRMWTLRLQEELGPRYRVVNLALRGATPMDGGAVVADALREEYPRLIYIANERPMTGFDAVGSNTYGSIFWQGYYSGQLSAYGPREEQAKRRLLDRGMLDHAPEIVGEAVLDRYLRFRDFWNRIAFTRLNTIGSIYAPAPPALFQPRSRHQDEEPDGTRFTLAERYRPEGVAREMEIVRANSEPIYRLGADGRWELDQKRRGDTRASFERALPPVLRARTLMLIGRDSPHYRNRLTEGERARDEQAIRDTVALYREVGYDALDYGTDFTEMDYSDRSHLTSSGGQKLATAVAAEVRRLAAQRGYLP